MKLVAIILFAACVQASASGYSQITLSETNMPLQKVFKKIQQQSGYDFISTYETLKQAGNVTVNVQNVSLQKALDECLKGKPLTYVIIGNTVVIRPRPSFNTNFATNTVAMAPPLFEIHGRVVNQQGQPLQNVSVLIAGTRLGTSTNSDGRFTLTAPDDKNMVLEISSVGYQTKRVSVGKQGEINVVLETDIGGLDDVVVIGYGSRKRKDLTGAVSTISSKDIEKSTAMSPELALQGRAPGVFVESGGGDPQSRPIVRIRGVNTFGYSEPLYVVDGVPVYEGGAGVTDGAIGDIRSPINIFSLINPDDIESISVLKDASAAAIYGVRASNGVILITTKKGKVGKPKIEASLSYGIQNIPKLMPVLNTQQYFSLVTEAYNNNPDMNSGAIIPIGTKFGGLYSADSSQYAGNDPTYDWQKELLNKDAPIQNYSVRVSGGTEGLNYYFSGNYAKTESPLKANSLERYSVATNIDARISRVFSAGITVRLVQENSFENTQGDLPTMASSIPFEPFYDKSDPTGFNAVASGSFVPNPDFDPSLLNPGAPYNFAAGDPRLLWGPQSRFNVFAFQQLNNNSYNLYNALGNAYVQVEPIEGLKIKASFGGSYYENLRKSWTAFDAWRFSQTPGNPYAGQDGNSKGGYGERQGKTININKELTVNYTHTFGKNHHLDVILGASDEYARWNVNDLSGQVNYSDPQYRSIVNQPPYTSGFASILQEDQLIGYLSRISYNYSEKYYLDATLRHDGSSRLAPGHKWGDFPSFAAAWRISSENFFPKTTFINDLKLRGGWGKLGNYQSAGYYEFLSGISTTPDYPLGSGNGDPYGTQYQGAALPSFANTTLGWEKVKTTSIGFDAVLLNNHVNFTAEYYSKLTYGIIQSVSLPPNTGIQNAADLNIGEVSNKGVEFDLGYNAKVGPVNFNVAGNLTTVNNKVIKLYGGTPLGNEFGRIEEGYSMFYLWGYKVGGVFQSQQDIDKWTQSHADINIGQKLGDPSIGYRYKPGDMYFQDVYGNPKDPKERYSKTPDSLINSNDRTYLGKTIPGYYYGFNIGANWKGIDISVFFQGVGDVQKYNSLRAGLENMSGLANSSSTTLDRWTPANASTSMPRAVYGDPAQVNRISNRFVENAGYLRLKNLQIGYSLPPSLMNKLGFIKKFRIYASAINLFTITNYTGYDPENDFIPPTRQFLAGLNLNF
ncbi:MAG: TonB-dependent receptor [Ginsengibacter sp.]